MQAHNSKFNNISIRNCNYIEAGHSLLDEDP